MPTDDELVSFFQRHVVPISFTFQKEQDTRSFIVTAFVLSVLDRWFLITAGHCIRNIENWIDHYGYDNTRSQLIDSLGLGATYREPIPFVYKDSYPTCLSDDYDFDYGVMALSPYYKQLLQANNVQALNEEVWKKQPVEVDFYTLLGIPAELVKVSSTNIELTPTLHPVERIDRRPEGFTKVDAPLFYGRIVLGEDMSSIKGMSGGPVFAFHQNDKGELRYWLIALQSRCLSRSLFIAACPTKLLGHFLEDVIVRVGQELTQHGPTPAAADRAFGEGCEK
jgi:hypothetical protein